jgi:hypothetical protein
MTIQEAMNKAVEGGYHIHGSDGTETDYEGTNGAFSLWTRTDNASSFMIPMEETYLDPRFWQALGRALGWSEVCDLAITCVHGEEECQRCRGYYWMYQWHCFIQAIADGRTPAAFFAQLPSSQTKENGHQPEASKDPLHPSLFLLIAEESRQHAQHICEEAAGAQEVAKDIVRMSRLARHRRRGA